MANTSIFKSIVGKLIAHTNVLNAEHSPAYALPPKQTLAQYAATGCLNATFYASGEEQLREIVKSCYDLDPLFISQTAIYSYEYGFMRDMPALLCALLSVKSPEHLKKIFHRVICNGKMLRNFVQIMRSGQIARKSLGSLPKKLILEWFEKHSDETLFRQSIGQNPSLGDIIKMVHPKPNSPERDALYGYLINKKHNPHHLPQIVQSFEAYKSGACKTIPGVPFQMLTSLDLKKEEWIAVARQAGWKMTLMNLNTFARHGVFESDEITSLIAHRIRDPKAIAQARAFPYQLMIAYQMSAGSAPSIVREALQDAMETATKNVPEMEGNIYLCPDVSSSMQSVVTGYRKGSTSKVRCIDVAALVASAFLRKNPKAQILPFEDDVVSVFINPRDTIMTNAEKLANIGGGGTNCSAPLALLNKKKAKGDLVVFISDNQSWVDARQSGETEMMAQWNRFKHRNPQAKLVCLDIAPYVNTQAQEREDILNIGGFSDAVFDLIATFTKTYHDRDYWVREIEKIQVH